MSLLTAPLQTGIGPSAPPPPGLRIANVEPESTLATAGLRPGDTLLAIEGWMPRDLVDLQFDLPDARRLTLVRDGVQRTLRLDEPAAPGDLSLDEPVPGGIRECNNHCEFCFIRGLPKGLRETLYVFDDDYRYSFLWGNFLTLTNLEESDWARLGFQRLSPLNVSVHATDPAVRRRLLNNRHAPPILPQLERLQGFGVQVNTQVVVCAGVNDGDVLKRTVHDLASLHEAVVSVSLVPVGLTRFSRTANIRRPTPAEALAIVEQAEAWQTEFRARCGRGLVYPSDEMYLRAGRPDVPPAAFYDGFPATANGVGVIRQMVDDWDARLRRRRRKPSPRAMAWLCGRLAAPALRRVADRWQVHAGWAPTIVEVENTFFGNDIGASGLLTGTDLLRTLRALPSDLEDVVIPAGAFGFDGTQTLDGVPAEEIGAAHPGRVHLASTPEDLLDILFR